jgi:hypothetical protein
VYLSGFCHGTCTPFHMSPSLHELQEHLWVIRDTDLLHRNVHTVHEFRFCEQGSRNSIVSQVLIGVCHMKIYVDKKVYRQLYSELVLTHKKWYEISGRDLFFGLVTRPVWRVFHVYRLGMITQRTWVYVSHESLCSCHESLTRCCDDKFCWPPDLLVLLHVIALPPSFLTTCIPHSYTMRTTNTTSGMKRGVKT